MNLVVDGHDTVDATNASRTSPAIALEATGGSDTRYNVADRHRLKRICFRAPDNDIEHVLVEASTAQAIGYIDSELISAPTVFCIHCGRHGNAIAQAEKGSLQD